MPNWISLAIGSYWSTFSSCRCHFVQFNSGKMDNLWTLILWI